MIETFAQREKRQKSEAQAREERAAKYAEWEAKQKSISAKLPLAATVAEEEKPFTKLTALSFTAEINRDAEKVGEKLLRAHRLKIWIPLCFDSWKDYVAEKLKFSRAQAYRLLSHAETVEQLPVSPNGDTLTESQTRPLNGLPVGQKKKAWKHAVKIAGGAPTGKQVAAAVSEMKPAKAHVIATEQNLPMHTQPEPHRCPHCGQTMP